MKFILEKIAIVKENHLLELERKYDISFPKELKKYYLKYGDSKIKKCEFNINGLDYEVKSMVVLTQNANITFETILEYGRGDWIPDDFFPIARDSGGDYYFWSSTNQHVYYICGDIVDKPINISNKIKDFFKLMENGVI